MSLELKRMQVELMRVTCAKHELELKIEEHKENIERCRAFILVQEAKEEELKQKIKETEGK